ncbi:S26 family signal peptidase [Haloarchaeobius salinus]|uniref:S26 family signal peptidase n=1 Tax=Haloarchaeobius salinus TaxID=1198298 RepID=UPI00210E9BD1|nr:S26 family signal peptidase [Haloarchaeobius salinus]
MTGPGSDDESDAHRDEGPDPRHDTDRDRAGADDAPDRDDGDPATGDDTVDETVDRETWEWVDTSSGREAAGDTDPSPPGDPDSDGDGPVEAGGPPEDTREPPEDTTRRPEPGSERDRDPTSERDRPPIPGEDERREEFDGPVDWFLHTDDSFVMTVRDVSSSLLTVAFIGIVLFGVSGIWPPLVAVESGSMEPHMHRNDLVFIVEEGRFAGDSAQPGTGVVTHRAAQQNDGYWSFGDYGNVIVYQPDGSDRRTPIIHRARFWVDEGENWVDSEAEGGTGKADPQHLSRDESADRSFDCEDITACPADYSGFVTKGDDNAVYDQIGGQSSTVRSEWVRGKAKVRIPLLGWIRLQFAQLATAFGGTGPTALGMLRLQLGVVCAGVGTVVARRRGVL